MDIKSVGLFTLQDESGQTAGDALEQYCAEEGIEVTTREYCNDTDTDYSGQVARLLATNPDTLFIGTSSPPVPIFVNTAREMGYDGLIFSKDTAMTTQIEQCGENINLYTFAFPSIVYTSVEAAGDNQVLRDFLEGFENEYGALPTVESTYRAYDSCLVFEEAINIANSVDPTAIKDAINQVKIEGTQGELDYTDGSGEPIKEIAGWIIVDGDYVRLDEWIASGAYEEHLATRKWQN
jgi:branched-chain amino acid transport system substrate-binding protein